MSDEEKGGKQLDHFRLFRRSERLHSVGKNIERGKIESTRDQARFKRRLTRGWNTSIVVQGSSRHKVLEEIVEKIIAFIVIEARLLPLLFVVVHIQEGRVKSKNIEDVFSSQKSY